MRAFKRNLSFKMFSLSFPIMHILIIIVHRIWCGYGVGVAEKDEIVQH